MIVHARSERQALQLRAAIAKRLAECGLELNEHKTRVVYCKDDDRRGSYEHTSFDFLSYTFRPRLSKSRFGKHFVNFSPAVSGEAKTRMRREMRRWGVARRSDKTLTDLALMFNRQIQGWINYYGRFYKSMLYPVFRHFNEHARDVGHAEIQTTCAATRAGRAGSSLTSQDASPACSRTGAGVCALTAGRWEPGELRGSRRVLRAPGGETPPGDSPRRALQEQAAGRVRAGRDRRADGGGRPAAPPRQDADRLLQGRQSVEASTSTPRWVGPGRGAGVTAGPFPRPALRTRRAYSYAPGSPQDMRWPIVTLGLCNGGLPAGWWPGLLRWSPPMARGSGGRDSDIGSLGPRRATRASCLRGWSSRAPSIVA